ncbi:PIG-X [Sordaria brevicollis]|uniref:Protein PBN1 n=1 Tax=Sordaria brevicollis TaxID=83679 RepID=A0AAE0P1G3_SORBR|nr:PIG-X [Sordaria brevicollis]
MRERITFIQKQGDSIEPTTLNIKGGVLNGPEIQAAREDRLTIAIDELPTDLQALLGTAHELHIRYVSFQPYEAITPLLARLPPGFHLFYTPATEVEATSPALCLALNKVFGNVQCENAQESFTTLPRDRFTHSAAYQYYQQAVDFSPFIHHVKDQLCSSKDQLCAARADRLAEASTLDISYDAISHAVKVTATWPYQRQEVHATSRPQTRTEVGVLNSDRPGHLEPHELGISGLLTVLGQDKKPSATMFAFASRHRDAESSFSVEFLEPTGLHPTLKLNLESSKPPTEDAYCSPHAYFTLPKTIFADRHQLSDDLFLASKNLTGLRYISQPVDLEAPEYVEKRWGSSLLLELSPPESEKSQSWTAQVPLHLRYLSPSEGGYTDIEVPYPAVFWACAAEEGTKFPNNPFEKVNLGYDGLFGPRTVFWHVDPQPGVSNSLTNTIKVPVLDTDKAEWVSGGTGLAVLLGFAWIVWKLFGVLSKSGYQNQSARAAEVAKVKKKQ